MNASPGNVITIVPSLWRLFMARLLQFLVPLLVGRIAGQLADSTMLNLDFVRDLLLYVVGLDLLLNIPLILLEIWSQGDRRIIIGATTIEGPGPSFGRRISFPLLRLDRERSLRRPWHHRLLGYRYLWSLDGERLFIMEIALTRDQLATLHNALRLGEGAFGYSLE